MTRCVHGKSLHPTRSHRAALCGSGLHLSRERTILPARADHWAVTRLSLGEPLPDRVLLPVTITNPGAVSQRAGRRNKARVGRPDSTLPRLRRRLHLDRGRAGLLCLSWPHKPTLSLPQLSGGAPPERRWWGRWRRVWWQRRARG